MSSTTIIIIVAVAVIWAILFAVFMKFNKKRQAGEQQFVQEYANKAILHIYGKSVRLMVRTFLLLIIKLVNMVKSLWQ